MKADGKSSVSLRRETFAAPTGPAGPITVRRVSQADAAALREIYDDIGAWLHEVKKITTQWDRSAPDGLIKSLLHSGETYLALVDDRAAGAVRVAEAPAVGLANWRNDALYVYSLAVRRRFAGLGLGRQILAWVEAMARTGGKSYLRLDCMADNARLVQYYVEIGFTFLGRHPNETWYALFEKEID
jgi:GNAT superfamily N-acetyltransferase